MLAGAEGFLLCNGTWPTKPGTSFPGCAMGIFVREEPDSAKEASLSGADAVKIQRSFTRERFVRDTDVRRVNPCASRDERRVRI